MTNMKKLMLARFLITFFCFYLLFSHNNILYSNEIEQNIFSNTKIVFSSYLDGDSDIYLINPDGSGLVNLTDDEYNNYLPTWSPDGEKIAFISLDEK